MNTYGWNCHQQKKPVTMRIKGIITNKRETITGERINETNLSR